MIIMIIVMILRMFLIGLYTRDNIKERVRIDPDRSPLINYSAVRNLLPDEPVSGVAAERQHGGASEDRRDFCFARHRSRYRISGLQNDLVAGTFLRHRHIERNGFRELDVPGA